MLAVVTRNGVRSVVQDDSIGLCGEDLQAGRAISALRQRGVLSPTISVKALLQLLTAWPIKFVRALASTTTLIYLLLTAGQTSCVQSSLSLHGLYDGVLVMYK